MAVIFTPSASDAVRELLASAKETAKALRAQADEAVRVERAWTDLLNFMTRGWPLHFLHKLNQEQRLVEKLRADGGPAIRVLDEARRTAEEEADRIRRRFPRLLEDACREAGIKLDTDSPHPRYTIEHRFFKLEIDDQKRMARLSDIEARLADMPYDVGAIVEAVQREHTRVFGRPFDAKRFLKTLWSNYSAIVKREKMSLGASVPIRKITRRLGKNAKGFRTDEFLIDLSRLLEAGPTEIDGWRLDLQQTKSTSDGMLLHGIAGRGYVGYVVFNRCNDGPTQDRGAGS